MNDQATHKKIEELRILESQLQNFLIQKQSIQLEINEINNALEEIKKTDDDVYKLVSGIMIKSEKNKLVTDLEEKSKLMKSRVESVENQEKILEKNASDLRAAVSNIGPEKK